jgi:hypothetical protein
MGGGSGGRGRQKRGLAAVPVSGVVLATGVIALSPGTGTPVTKSQVHL